MVVLYASQCVYSITRLTRGDVADICHGLAHERVMGVPNIDVNYSNVCLKVGTTAQGVANHLMMRAKAG